MTGPSRDADRPPEPDKSKGRRWSDQFTAGLLGVAIGLGVNALSEDFTGYRLTVALFAALATVQVAVRFRRLPPRAPLVRYGVRLALTLAFAVAVAAALLPSPWATYAALTAASLTAVAVSRGPRALRILGSATLIGIGLTIILVGVTAMLTRGHELFWASGAALGVVAISLGIALLTKSNKLFWASTILWALASITSGIAELAKGDELGGAAQVIFGVVAISLGIAQLTKSDKLFWASMILCALTSITLGIAILAKGDELGGAMTGLGVAILGVAIVMLTKSNALYAVALLIAIGVALVGLGSATWTKDWLLGAMIIGSALVPTLWGLQILRHTDTRKWARAKLATLTREPDSDSTSPPERRQDAQN